MNTKRLVVTLVAFAIANASLLLLTTSQHRLIVALRREADEHHNLEFCAALYGYSSCKINVEHDEFLRDVLQKFRPSPGLLARAGLLRVVNATNQPAEK
jgi:hypothetical protein